MGAIMALEAPEAAVHGRDSHQFTISARRHHQMDPRLEAQWLEDRRQEAGQEHGTLAAARCRPSAATRSAGTG